MAATEGSAQPAWPSADDESLNLIISLLREDADQVRSVGEGEGVESRLSDADLALQLQTEELDRAAVYASDRRMTKSMQSAVQVDANALVESLRELAREDEETAMDRPGGALEAQSRMLANSDPSATELGLLETLEELYITRVDEVSNRNIEEPGDPGNDDGDGTEAMPADSEGQSNSRPWALFRRVSQLVQRPCVSCGDAMRPVDLVRAPCQHEYCRECVQTLFRIAMSDESLFPPRCCRQEMPVDTNLPFLGDDLVQQFERKAIEFSTPNRTYCHQVTCSAFIPPSTITDGVALCPECKTQTCIICKGATHQGDCPEDKDLQQVLEVARQEGWQRCSNCSTMIELNTGCYHMTCKCGNQFCYLCALRWKTCACVQWDEHRLFNRAREIHNRDDDNTDDDSSDDEDVVDIAINPQPIVPVNNGRNHATRAANIQRIMRDLRQNHECDHLRWSSRTGSYRYEECNDMMPEYIYECRDCSIMACRRCRYNRL